MSIVKNVVLVKRRKGMTMQQFKDHWLNNHAVIEREIVEQRPSCQKIVASFALGDGSAIFDGMAEIYSDTELAKLETTPNPLSQKLMKDEENFIDNAGQTSTQGNKYIVKTEEYVIAEKQNRDMRKSLVKNVVLVKRRHGMTMQQFKDHWLNNHAVIEREIVTQRPSCQKIVASFALGDGGAIFDGMAEIYSDTELAKLETTPNPLSQKLMKDEENFIDNAGQTSTQGNKYIVKTEEFLIGEKTTMK